MSDLCYLRKPQISWLLGQGSDAQIEPDFLGIFFYKKNIIQYHLFTKIQTLDFFLNVSWIRWIQWQKIFVIRVKGLEPATSCVRDQDATTLPARHMWETAFLNWTQFKLQWFIRFPEFAEFNCKAIFTDDSSNEIDVSTNRWIHIVHALTFLCFC